MGVLEGMRCVVALGLLCGACGSDPPPPPKVPEPEPSGFEEDANVDVDKARRIIKKAKAVLDEKGDLELARRVLRKAEPFANATVLEEIRRVSQTISDLESDQLVPPVIEAAEGGRCVGAVDTAAQIMKEHKATTVPAFVRQKVSAPLLRCLMGQLDIDVSVGREYAANKNVERVLDKASYQILRNKVDSVTVGTVVAELDEPIKKRQWKQVKEKISELFERKEAGDKQYDRVMSLMRSSITEEIEETVTKNLGASLGASAGLRKIDQLIELAAWGTGKTDKSREQERPKRVDQARTELAFWVACSNIKCRMVTPTKMWTHGNTEVHPLVSPRGKSTEVVGHAMTLWKIAESSSSTLVARSDPGALTSVASRVPVALGWVSNSRLESTNTAEWLPPGDAIVGTRVWGPLRQGESTFELGTVTSAAGDALKVERMADLVVVDMRRGRIRFGVTHKGLKVLTHCSHPTKPQPAIIVTVTPTSGDPVATVTCLDEAGEPNGVTRREQLAALRTQASWLPPRK